jgi:acetylornithine/N-succinyldiaminopimelate aminotransferase
VMERENVPQMAEHAGSRLRHQLEAVPGVVEVRGLGLLLAAQLADGIDARGVAADALDAGLIVNAVSPASLRLAPPLTVSNEEIDEAVALLSTLIASRLAEVAS